MPTIREYIAETGVRQLSLDAFVQKYAKSPPMLMGLRGECKEDTTPVMTVVLSPGRKRKDVDPLSRFMYPVENVEGRHSFGLWVTVGRAMNNDVILNNPSVSKFHATIRHVGESYLLCDRGSMNGTAVIRGEITERLSANKDVVLEDRCTLEFGGPNGEVMMYLASPKSVYEVLRGFEGF